MFLRNIFNWVIDGATSFETQSVVKVRDPRLGLFNTLLFVLVLVYIGLFELMYKRGYMDLDNPSGGSIRISVRVPDFEELESSKNLDYCTKDFHPSLGCRYMAQFYGGTEHSILVPTRVNLTLFNDTKSGCPSPQHGLISADRNCIYDIYENNPNEYLRAVSFYASYPESYTFIVDHSILSPLTGDVLTSNTMRGDILDLNDKSIFHFPLKGKEKDYVFSVDQLLKASGTDLDDIPDGKTLPKRYEGMVLLVLINYENPWYRPWEIAYEMTVREANGADFKYVESVFDNLLSTEPSPTTHFTVVNAHGIRVMFIQTGSIGVFSIINLILNIVAGMAMLDLSQWVVEFVMLSVVKEKNIYEKYKYTVTEPWEEMRRMAFSESGEIQNNAHNTENPPELKTLGEIEDAMKSNRSSTEAKDKKDEKPKFVEI